MHSRSRVFERRTDRLLLRESSDSSQAELGHFTELPDVRLRMIRQKAMPLIGEDPTRVPDHLFSGPDLEVNDDVRARLFSER
jgi:hypothetical protein